ncbi:MAG: hypothetical protein M1840_006711 [Geoglossum simile]|nr:MAG: hypothetical protein M1840_006711 [Geoglossum simile]
MARTPRVCSECGRKFNQDFALNKHIREGRCKGRCGSGCEWRSGYLTLQDSVQKLLSLLNQYGLPPSVGAGLVQSLEQLQTILRSGPAAGITVVREGPIAGNDSLNVNGGGYPVSNEHRVSSNYTGSDNTLSGEAANSSSAAGNRVPGTNSASGNNSFSSLLHFDYPCHGGVQGAQNAHLRRNPALVGNSHYDPNCEEEQDAPTSFSGSGNTPNEEVANTTSAPGNQVPGTDPMIGNNFSSGGLRFDYPVRGGVQGVRGVFTPAGNLTSSEHKAPSNPNHGKEQDVTADTSNYATTSFSELDDTLSGGAPNSLPAFSNQVPGTSSMLGNNPFGGRLDFDYPVSGKARGAPNASTGIKNTGSNNQFDNTLSTVGVSSYLYYLGWTKNDISVSKEYQAPTNHPPAEFRDINGSSSVGTEHLCQRQVPQ